MPNEMRFRTAGAILLGTTALTTPTPAHAGPVLLFLQGVAAYLGVYGAAGAAVATAIGGAAAIGVGVAGFLFGSVLGRLLLSVGLSAISAALARPNIPSPSDRIVNFAQPVSYFEHVIGRARKGGPYAVSAFNLDRRHYAVILAAHQIDGIEAWYLDDRLVLVDAETGTVTSDPYSPFGYGLPHVNLRPHLGAPGQAADATLVSGIPEWTSNHDMAGLAYVAAWALRPAPDNFAYIYGNSPETGPEIAPVLRGALCYDPRSDETVWTDNAELVFAWICTERFGLTVNWDHVAYWADVCDELVTNRDGGTQRRWTINGTFDDRADFETLRQQWIAACDGYVFNRADGSVGFQPGKYETPTITLTDDDFRSLVVNEQPLGPGAPTEFAAVYTEPDLGWREAPSAIIDAAPDAYPVRRDVAIYWSNSHNQTLRCLKRIAKVSRPSATIQGEIGAIGYELLSRSTPDPGGVHRFVRVQAGIWDLVVEIGKIRHGETIDSFIIEGTATTAADHDFDAATEEPAPPTRETPTSDDTVAAPASLTGTAVDGPGIRWAWPTQAVGVTQELALYEAGESVPLLTVAITNGDTSVTTLGLVDGADYEAEIRNMTGARRPSAWTSSGTVTAVATATAPDPVEDFSATDSAGDVTLEWVTANDPLHHGVRVYRADYAPAYADPVDIADAEVIATVYGPASTLQTLVDAALDPGVYAWWALAINSSGIEATAAGPETIEIT